MARIIGEVRPKYAFVENSPMLTSRGLGTVLRDLATMGYDAEWCVLGASDVGARHQRERIWLIAKDTQQSRLFSHTEHNGIGWGKQQSESIAEKNGAMANTNSFSSKVGRNDIANEKISGRWFDNGSGGGINDRWKFDSTKNENVANSSMPGLSSCNKPTSRPEQQVLEKQSWRGSNEYGNKDYWEAEPNVGRVVNGLASRVDRLKAIGNGQVPLCAATAWNILKGRVDGKSK
jgi:DNA (cytosine-5)-methyltransferase 1